MGVSQVRIANVIGLICIMLSASQSVAQKVRGEEKQMPLFPPYPDSYNVVWETPSRDSSGSMPLGNGDIGVNVWVEEDGDLLFYISKTDAWDENARLVKLGRVRVHFEPNAFRAGLPFRQVLNLKDGEVEITAGERQRQLTLRLWVDANHPVIRLEAESESPFAMQVQLELWRTKPRELKGRELFSAYGMQNAPHPVIIYPDTVAGEELLKSAKSSFQNAIVWFHRNEHSIWSATMKLQGLEPLMEQLTDPLLHRTFGGVIRGEGLKKVNDTTLRSAKARQRFVVSIYALTEQTESVQEWLDKLADMVSRVDTVKLATARKDHQQWWQDFWKRSWIQVVGSVPGERITTNNLPLRIGADSEGQNRFHGKMRRAWLFSRALEPQEIAALVQGKDVKDGNLVGDWVFDASHKEAFPNRAKPNLPARIVGRVEFVEDETGAALRFTGEGFLEIEPNPLLNLTEAVTMAAWIAPDALPHGGGRILDKCKAGTANGYLLDTYPGNSLRMIVEAGTLIHDAKLPPGRWVHVAATYDARNGQQALFINGQQVASQSLGIDGFVITQGYALQRFINACAGRGAYPIKFNGSIFTVDAREGDEQFDADYRRWGGPYWFQNTRLIYWSMLKFGDFDLMLPLFRMYRDMLPLCIRRTQLYFNHNGAFFPETLYFWGCYANDNYGWNRQGKPISHIDNTYIRYYFQGGLELVAMMLDYFGYTQDRSFAEEFLLPIADAVLAFYEQHFPRDPSGKLLLKPAQSLETWQNVINPLPDIAGLHWVLDGLMNLPVELVGQERRSHWERLRSILPPVPIGEEKGQRFLLPAQEILGPRQNVENPELYAIFPYRIYGIGKPDLELGRTTFERRQFKRTGGWQQDAIQAAYLGLTETAIHFTAKNLATHHEGSRFLAFWGPNFDWVPDQDHGCVAMTALQAMILQADSERILLFPAWPKELDVSFRLHAPLQTVVEGIYHNGRLERLIVKPAQRRKDLVIMK